MSWKRLGLLVEANPNLPWSYHYASIPTAYRLNENVVRVLYYSMDEGYNGRISFIDVNAKNPAEILVRSESVILDIGQPGMFDDCGVCPLQTITINNELHLYYLGVQRVEKVPYLYFCGLAKWNESQQVFERVQQTPVLERTHEEPHIRSAVTLLPTENGFEMWYVGASDWVEVNGKAVPTYRIHRAESTDGLTWNVTHKNCISFKNEDEFGFGRPWVMKSKQGYEMFYSIRSRSKGYRLGYAQSKDGIAWERKDESLGIDIGVDAWENESICYPCVIDIENKRYLFYNGNGNGRTGFGLAVWEDEHAS
jgi:hypothetical protein